MANSTQSAGEYLSAAPPVAIGGLTFFGVSLPDVVLLLTAGWTVLQILLGMRRLYRSMNEPAIPDPECAENCPALKRARKGK